ncbi:hypothetical protein PybrP1_000149 [[Pythium] brassicae (nom. inval.)]|nr:hypothetical protein PybrP1_000149 [[Pythium] brassicae (nom. inval.)]
MAKLQADDSRKRARAPAVAARKKPAKKTPEPQEQTDEDAESDAHTGADATNTGDDNTGDDNTGDEGAQEEGAGGGRVVPLLPAVCARSVVLTPAESASEDDAPVKRKKTKAAPKPKAKPAGKQAAKAPVAKKRRVRSQEDKLRENAPMNQPFFVETGSDWGSTDIGAVVCQAAIEWMGG